MSFSKIRPISNKRYKNSKPRHFLYYIRIKDIKKIESDDSYTFNASERNRLVNNKTPTNLQLGSSKKMIQSQSCFCNLQNLLIQKAVQLKVMLVDFTFAVACVFGTSANLK